MMIEKIEKSAGSSQIETWHRFRRRVQLKPNIKNPFKRILDKKIRQLRREKIFSENIFLK